MVPEVRRATPEDMTLLTRSLASAFVDDPVSAFIFPDGERRETILREFFAVQLSRTYLPRGEVYTTGDTIGAAMWLPPDSRLPTVGDQLAYLRVSLASGSYWSARRLAVALQRYRPVLAHYYLGTIGVAPAHQRGGLGSALMGPGLARCDAMRLGAYLECSTEPNTHFYERLGFRVTREIRAPRGGPRLWLMWREPAEAGPSRSGELRP
jgi:ribosomal protein S18 acetylase RimI-like enzyme